MQSISGPARCGASPGFNPPDIFQMSGETESPKSLCDFWGQARGTLLPAFALQASARHPPPLQGATSRRSRSAASPPGQVRGSPLGEAEGLLRRRMKHLLIVGRPGTGKTTLIKHVAAALRGKPIDGFVTEEVGEGDERLGFWLSSLDGRQVLLAHRRLQEGPRVGPYRVNMDVLEQVAIPVLERGIDQDRKST